MSLKECEELCLRNCSCTAYANLDIREGIGYLVWFNELVDMTEFNEDGQDIYIRLAKTDLGSCSLTSSNLKHFLVCKTSLPKFNAVNEHRNDNSKKNEVKEKAKGSSQSHLHHDSYRNDTNATDNFSSNNKWGQGGFGHVYKVMKQYAVCYLFGYAEYHSFRVSTFCT
ncbi:hypothetical protein DITRI_Ditri14bG0124600 [Diplodiscus trichospermus]